MSSKIIVGYDGSESSTRALSFAVDRAKAEGSSLVIAYVLEWSPYSFLTPTELEERHARRKEELKRAEEHIGPIVKETAGKGVSVEAAIKYGHIADTICQMANDGASQIIIGRSGESAVSARIFGSVAGSLAQAAPVPVTIVP